MILCSFCELSKKFTECHSSWSPAAYHCQKQFMSVLCFHMLKLFAVSVRASSQILLLKIRMYYADCQVVKEEICV